MTPEELYESHEYLIKKTLYKTYKFPRELCRKNQIEYEDLLQYARTGLWKAAITYKSTKGKLYLHRPYIKLPHIHSYINQSFF